MTSLKRQQGAVIVVALFFVALVAAMAYAMMSRLERDTYRTRLLLRTTQAELYAQGSIDWAIEQLHANLSKQKPNVIVDDIPIQSPVNEMNGYTISSKITDMQSRINLNNADVQTDLKRLMQILSIDEQKGDEIILAFSDWIKGDQQQNEYNQYYMSISPPYRAAHRPMMSASELQLVKGMTPAILKALQPYITALPVPTNVNVQTAPAEVMAAISQGMTLATGKEIEKIRSEKKIASKDAFLKLDIVKNHPMPDNKIIDVSQYFLVETRVAIEKQQVVLYTLLERTGNESKNSVKVIWQSKGVRG